MTSLLPSPWRDLAVLFYSHRQTGHPVSDDKMVKGGWPNQAIAMGRYSMLIEQLAAGRTVNYREYGHSMQPILLDRSVVSVAPAERDDLAVGDIVLAKVKGRVFLHKVTALDPNRVQISNNHGHVNGWTSRESVYGRLIAVNGRPVRRDGRPERSV